MENADKVKLTKQKAGEIFRAYSDIDEVFITSDLQGFTEKEKADNHADYLTDKKVHHFYRNSDFEDEPNANSEEPTAESEDRTALLAEYEQLFGQKPPHNIGTTKLKEKIEEKKAELNAQN